MRAKSDKKQTVKSELGVKPMNIRNKLAISVSLAATLALVGCGGSSNDSPAPTATPTATPTPTPTPTPTATPTPGGSTPPTTYTFADGAGADTVSYTGQTKRHIFIDDMVRTMQGLVEGGVPTGGTPNANVADALNFFFRFDGSTSDTITSTFSLTGENLLPNDGSNLTYGSISSGKDLVGKIAGGDGQGGGETTRLINNEFFGWQTGLNANALPVDLVDYFFAQLQAEATDNATPMIPVGATTVPLDTVTVSRYGLDYRQLIQKFLLGAVTFSQGTNDYFQTEFASASNLMPEGNNPYTAGEHDWDEAFGYFGAARNFNDYMDDEIAGKGGRAEYENGYNDANGDGLVDIRSEFNFGNSTNCAKRDRATTSNPNPTNFTKDAFDAFLAGRQILRDAAVANELTAAAQAELNMHIEVASTTWEKCVAATVVHYINDVLGNMDDFDSTTNTFSSLGNFKDLAKHWGEMKGFALGLQFSPASPFRESDTTLANLRQILTLMGDAPVFPDGTQAGQAFSGGIATYRDNLLTARNMLQSAYSFDATNVENW